MHLGSVRSRNAWILPIVLAVCGLMLTPAGALLARPTAPLAPHVGAASHASPSTPPSSGTPSLPTHLPPLSHALSPIPAAASLPSARSSPSLPDSSSHAPWLQHLGGGSTSTLLRSGYAPLVSPPNLGLASDPRTAPGAVITPGYSAPPAPMGLADYGYGAGGAYAYNTSSFEASIDLASPPNVTAPGSEGVIDPQGSALGLVGSPYEFSLQLNTVGTNFTEPNTSVGAVWAQNVLDINDSAIHFVDDVWNLTANSSFAFAPNAIVSGCRGANVAVLLALEGGVYQCVGGSLSISPADFPLSIDLFNNVSTNTAHQDVLAFGYAIWGHGVLLGAGDYDTLLFANPSGLAPAHPVAYSVNGFHRAPAQPTGFPELLEDSEITFGGPIGGANAVFRSLHGTLALDYWNGAAFTTIPSAYNFGSDTGETAVGVAGFWNATGVEEINQGPSFLYGLWNTPSVLGVAPGAIQFQGSINESYGFVFVSNVNPLVNETNLSYVPTTVTGAFDSWLPPAVPTFGSVYFTEAFAPGNFSVLGPVFSTNQTAYTFPVMPSSFGYLEAPLYLDGGAQAASLAYNLTGRPLAATTPYYLWNLVVNLPIPFTHLNDYDFPTFVIVQAEGLSIELNVRNVTEGSNAFGGELYTLDFALPPAVPGWLTPAPSIVGPWKNFTEQINAWGSYDPWVSFEDLNGSSAFPNASAGSGGAVFFFGDLDAVADDVHAANLSNGVANIKSTDTEGVYLAAQSDANAFEDIGSWYSFVYNVTAVGASGSGESIGVYALSSHFGTLVDLTAVDGAVAFYAGADTGGGFANSLLGSIADRIYNVVAVLDAAGVVLHFSAFTTVTNVTVLSGAIGGVVDRSYVTAFDYLNATGAYGVDLEFSEYSSFYRYNLSDYEYGSYWISSNYTSVRNATFVDYDEAIFGGNDNLTSITNLTVFDAAGPSVYLFGLNWTSFTNLTVEFGSGFSVGVVVGYAQNTSFANVTVANLDDDAIGVAVGFSQNTTFTATVVEGLSYSATGVLVFADANTSVAHTAASFLEYGASAVNVTESNRTTIANLTVEDTEYGALGASVFDSSATAFLGLEVLGVGPEAEGVVVFASNLTSFATTEIGFLGPDAYGVVLELTNASSFNGTEIGPLATQEAGVLLLGAYATSFVHTTIVDMLTPTSYGVAVVDSSATSFAGTGIYYSYNGVLLEGDNGTSLVATVVDHAYLAVGVNYSNGTTFHGLSLNATTFGVRANGSANLSATGVYVNSTEVGIFVNDAISTSVSNLSVNSSSYLGAAFTNSTGVTISNVAANGSVGAGLENCASVTASTISVTYGGLGLELVNVAHATVTGVSATYGATGVAVDPSQDVTVANVTATDGATGVELQSVTNFGVTNVTATNDSLGVVVGNGTHGSITDVAATNLSLGVVVEGVSAYLSVSDLSATNVSYAMESMGVLSHTTVANVLAVHGSVGVVIDAGVHNSVTNVTATDRSAGVGIGDAAYDTVSHVTVSDLSGGVLVFLSNTTTVTDVTATNATTSDPWTTGYLASFGIPAAAVLTEDDFLLNISQVSATHYPLALFDLGSADLFVQSVNASYGDLGVVLNGTSYSLLSGVGAYNDTLGLIVTGGAVYNTVTASRFVNDTGYGVDLLGGTFGNLVYDNDFVGDNGANNLTYQATHVQAFSLSADNWFNNSAKIGNFWADWHVYSGGVLAPYYVANGAWDYHPLGAPEGSYLVTLTAVGLSSGTPWSVTLGGERQSTFGATIVFAEYPGTYVFSVGALAGWTIAPASGAVVVTSQAVNVSIAFEQNLSVTFSESGLPGATGWSVVLNGVEASGTGTSIGFTEVAGSYVYTVVAPANWAASPASGTITISGNWVVPVTFTSTLAPTYTVWLNETGLSGATSWGAYFNGVPATTTGTSLAFSVPAGTYDFQIDALAGYTASPSGGNVTVSGNHTVLVAFAPTFVPVKVQIHETGLPKGTDWSAYVDGILGSSGGGDMLNVTVNAGGSYLYEVEPIAGYTIAHASATITVGTTTYVVTVVFSPITYTVTFGESGLSAGTVWSVVVDGSPYTTSSTSLTVALANGSYTYTFGAVSGYTVSKPSGEVNVTGGPAGAAAGYAPTSTPSYVAGSTFNTDWAIALAIGAVAVVLALVALLRRPRAPPAAPPASWQEGPSASGGESGSQGPSK